MRMAEKAARRERFWKRLRRPERRRAQWSPAVNDTPVSSILSPHIRREAR